MIKLEPFVQSDFQQLINWIDNEELLIQWCGSLFSFPLTMRSLEWYVRDTNVINESDAFVYKAVETETGRCRHITPSGAAK